ncbi:MAG: chloride channel protein [Bacillota bacterium]
MKKRLKEETVILISVVKWVVLATCIGLIVGAAAAVFLRMLQYGINLGARWPYTFYLLPAAMFLTVIAIKYLAPDAKGHGTEKVIEAVHERSGKIKAAVVPVKLFATIVTIAAGGSVGKEGPCAQIGAGLSSIFADIFRFGDDDRKKLVICGISAGFASVFGTPIAGAIFGVEAIFIGSLLYDVLLPSFVAGIVSFNVSSALGITYFNHPVNFMHSFNQFFFFKIILAGIFFGLCARFLIEIIKLGEKGAEKIKIWPPLKGFLGGIILIFLAVVFSRQYLGLGVESIEACLSGNPSLPWYAFILKSVFTGITLGFGGSGGVVTPIFFVGTAAGAAFAGLFGLSMDTFAAIGMVSLLAGAANTPIAASIMAVELFGPSIAPYAAISCIISFLITGHHSIYASQRLAIKKSASIDVELGKRIEDIEPSVKPRKKSFLGLFLRIIKKDKRETTPAK